MIGYRYKATVIKVIDGDTVECLVDLGFKIEIRNRFRLARINAPELHSTDPIVRDAAKKTLNYVIDKIQDEAIEVVSYKTEKYGRYLAEIYYQPTAQHRGEGTFINLNDELLSQGLAIKYE